MHATDDLITTEPPPPGWRLPRWWPWGVGVLLGLGVLGRGLGPGHLLSLDLLVTDVVPVPNGIFGLGPALSQRVPLFGLLGGASWLVGGPVAVKIYLVAAVAAAFAGAVRLAAGAPLVGQVAAGVLWAAGPFALTRIGAGHLNLVWALGALPWALPRLCRPAEHLGATFLAVGLVAVGGPGSGTLALAVVAIALVVGRGRRAAAVLAVSAAASSVWIAPTAVLLWAGAGVTGSGEFVTQGVDLWGWPSLAAGDGFWRADHQVGATGVGGVLAGLLLGVLAWSGRRARPERWWCTASVVAVAGFVLAVVPAVPVLGDGYRWLSDLPVGAPLREGQRFLALWLVWAAPAAAHGAGTLAGRLRSARPGAGGLGEVVVAVPLAVALAISAGGWWGVGGRLDPVQLPEGWRAARAVVHEHPGLLVALPWHQYPTLSFAEGRTVFNPAPEHFGGEVLSSYDPEFDTTVPSQEQVDRRATVFEPLDDRLRAGGSVTDELVALGVRWVFLAHEDRWTDYAGLARDPGLRHVVAGPGADLFEVEAWNGPVRTPTGEQADLRRPVPPVLVTDAPPGSVLHVAGAPGWVQGWFHPVTVTAEGELRVEHRGVVWFWPAVALIVLDLGLAVAAFAAHRRWRRAVRAQ